MKRIPLLAAAAAISLALSYAIVTFLMSGGDEADGLAESQPFVGALLARSGMFRVIAEEFPEGFEAIIDEVAAAAPSGDAAVQETAARAVGELRAAEADHLLAASGSALTDVVRENIATHRLIRDVAGDEACARFGLLGPPSLGDLAMRPDVMAQLDRQGAALFRAMASGEDATPRLPADDAVWAAVIRYEYLSEAEQEHIRLVGQQDANQPGYCDALIWFMERLADADGEMAVRAKAAFGLQLARG